MLLLSLPFLFKSTAKAVPAARLDLASAIASVCRCAAAATAAGRHDVVDGLDHYIDSRVPGARFRVE